MRINSRRYHHTHRSVVREIKISLYLLLAVWLWAGEQISGQWPWTMKYQMKKKCSRSSCALRSRLENNSNHLQTFSVALNINCDFSRHPTFVDIQAFWKVNRLAKRGMRKLKIYFVDDGDSFWLLIVMGGTINCPWLRLWHFKLPPLSAKHI